MATIFGDVQYTQVMGHLTTPDLPLSSSFHWEFVIHNSQTSLELVSLAAFSRASLMSAVYVTYKTTSPGLPGLGLLGL